ncbi:MAG: hypothetical protein IH621_07490 [Krumholzibacteria bacterium]|nr:hypothetical protein [Candidatus Krumholzibacteria bacterium]
MKRIIIALLVTLAAAAPAQEPGPADALWPLYQQGDFDAVIRQGKELLISGEETAQVNLAVGRALADLGQWAEAEVFLRRAADLDATGKTWVYAWAYVYLGNAAWTGGEPDAARQAWILARDAGATPNATRAARMNLVGLGLDESFASWHRFTTDHFAFLFSDRLVDLDRTVYAREHEEAYAAISAWFGGGPEQPIRFIVWADQDEATAAGMPELGFARPELNLVHCLVQQTVGHEMTHVIAVAARQPTVRIGLINEGTAVFHDRTGRDRLAVARRVLAAATTEAGGPLPPVALRALWDDWSLLPAGVSYPLAGAWVERLVEKGGREKFLEFFRDQSREHARQVYGADLEGWIDGFEADLAR